MQSNAYFLAKFRFDTAENEPAKNLQTMLILPKKLLLANCTAGGTLIRGLLRGGGGASPGAGRCSWIVGTS